MRTKLTNAHAAIISKFEAYESNAVANTLFQLESCAWGHGEQEITGGISKTDFVSLYTEQMVKSTSGRIYYDSLMMLAPLEKCPFCGFGQVTTLDHFLSKAYYPVFSVLPSNLVPACGDCNKSKGTSVVNQDTQIPHPYFVEDIVATDQWLFAEVNETIPLTINYLVRPPNSWPNDLSRRVNNYFDSLDLARRFAIEAASEVVALSDYLCEIDTANDRRDHLLRAAGVETRRWINSWRAALFIALSQSDWFRDVGYRLGRNVI